MNLTLWAVVAVALFFDFTNGFHDTANAIATSVSTRAMSPRTAVLSAAVLNFAGAFVSFAVAATIAKGIVDQEIVTPEVILAGLVGAITWNLITWYLGLPSSSSHALIGGVLGSAVAAAGFDIVKWGGLKEKVLIPSLLAPFLGLVIAAPLMIGIIMLALIATGHLAPTAERPPTWVILGAAIAMAAGTYAGGWRIIKTLGTRIAKLDPPQGFAAQTACASILWATAHYGFPVSTTHTISGSVMGAGASRRLSAVCWGVAGNILGAWVMTIPCAAAVGATMELVTRLPAGDAIVFVFAAAIAALAFTARRWQVRRLTAAPA